MAKTSLHAYAAEIARIAICLQMGQNLSANLPDEIRAEFFARATRMLALERAGRHPRPAADGDGEMKVWRALSVEQRLSGWLGRTGARTVTIRDLSRFLHMRAIELEPMIPILIQRGLLRLSMQHPAPTGGRPTSTRYDVQPFPEK